MEVFQTKSEMSISMVVLHRPVDQMFWGCRVQVVFLDPKEAIKLAVASLSSSCNLLLLAFLDVQIVKGPAAYSEMSLPLAVYESPELNFAIDVQKLSFRCLRLWLVFTVSFSLLN